ncbi:formylglycine-generating enzyme family protein [[Leptolyngbya] sp. PCC 7376]|uniref:formylglycine-generating enzyme family protein n=1 Tax=[Leptolyngbya] sp. PCC 7376 TaxID=111781 RepID=UPI0002DCD704|nr:formylglycine-generating enzyme family protein [[Leptolyngbya] sp. PCC 7376]
MQLPKLQLPKLVISRRKALQYIALGGLSLSGACGAGNLLKRAPKRKSFDNFTENGIAADIPLEMVAIPAGTFWMGSPETEKDRHDNEGPQHKVSVPAFFMGKYEITQAQWRSVASWDAIERELSLEPSYFTGNDNLPVEQVLSLDAVEFCKRLSSRTGRKYRLPTEAEWEYSCRAVRPVETPENLTLELWNQKYLTRFYFGDDDNYSSLGDYAWLNINSNAKSHPVGEKKPNNFGLYDMSGNVGEWCQDDLDSSYQNAPNDGSAWEWEDQSDVFYLERVERGGSWLNDPKHCRSANRDGHLRESGGSPDLGFRVACSLSSMT